MSSETLIEIPDKHSKDDVILPEHSKEFLKKMEKRLENKFNMHVDSTMYYKKMHILVTIPSIVITAFSSVAAFLSTSSLVPVDIQSGFSISVGVIAAVSTMLQTFSSGFRYPARIEAHSVAAQQYANLKTTVVFEEEIPDENYTEFTNDLEKKIIDIQSKCNFFIPDFIRKKVEDSNP